MQHKERGRGPLLAEERTRGLLLTSEKRERRRERCVDTQDFFPSLGSTQPCCHSALFLSVLPKNQHQQLFYYDSFFKKKTRIEVCSDGSTNNPAIYNDVILSIPFFLLPTRAQVHGTKKPYQCRFLLNRYWQGIADKSYAYCVYKSISFSKIKNNLKIQV